jgi:hypothetical protein
VKLVYIEPWPERAGKRKGKGDSLAYLMTTGMAGLNRVGREN